jgi:hypothetical protein
VLSGRPVYRTERCLLATGVADAAFKSKVAGGAAIATPWLGGDGSGDGGDGAGGIAYTIADDQDVRMWRCGNHLFAPSYTEHDHQTSSGVS